MTLYSVLMLGLGLVFGFIFCWLASMSLKKKYIALATNLRFKNHHKNPEVRILQAKKILTNPYFTAAKPLLWLGIFCLLLFIGLRDIAFIFGTLISIATLLVSGAFPLFVKLLPNTAEKIALLAVKVYAGYENLAEVELTLLEAIASNKNASRIGAVQGLLYIQSPQAIIMIQKASAVKEPNLATHAKQALAALAEVQATKPKIDIPQFEEMLKDFRHNISKFAQKTTQTPAVLQSLEKLDAEITWAEFQLSPQRAALLNLICSKCNVKPIKKHSYQWRYVVCPVCNSNSNLEPKS